MNIEKIVERYHEVPIIKYVDKEIHVDKIREIPVEKTVMVPHPV